MPAVVASRAMHTGACGLRLESPANDAGSARPYGGALAPRGEIDRDVAQLVSHERVDPETLAPARVLPVAPELTSPMRLPGCPDTS